MKIVEVHKNMDVLSSATINNFDPHGPLKNYDCTRIH